MNEALQILDLGRTGTIIGLVSFFLGIAVTYYFYKKSESKIQPAYVRYDDQVIEIIDTSLQRDIKLLYKNKEVTNLVKTVLVIWNDGRKTLDKSHITTTCPPQIKFHDRATIYSWAVKRVSNALSEVTVRRSSDAANSLELSFSHLDHCDGAVIEIYHDDTWGWPLIISGFKECRSGFDFRGRITQSSLEAKPKSLIAKSLREHNIPKIQIALGLLLIIFGLLPHEVRNSLNNPEWMLSFQKEMGDSRMIPIAVGILFTLISTASLMQKSKKRFPDNLVQVDPPTEA